MALCANASSYSAYSDGEMLHARAKVATAECTRLLARRTALVEQLHAQEARNQRLLGGLQQHAAQTGLLQHLRSSEV